MLSPAPASPDPTTLVARLTDKERECLDRWLDHATAKEIGLELGISHHAVEKRLKSARQKLGVSTTLDAARLLAAAEGYGRTASNPPEVVEHGKKEDAEAAPETRLTSAGSRWRPILLAGVLIMSLTLLTLALLGSGNQPAAPTNAQPRAIPEVMIVDRRSGQTGNADGIFTRLFARLDKDSSGFLESGELAANQFRLSRARDGVASPADSTPVDLAGWDKDADKRLSSDEFRTGFASLSQRR